MSRRSTLTLTAEDVRFADGDEGTFTGYAARFNEVNSYAEQIKPGAFKKTLKEQAKLGGPAMFWNHNSDEPIGRWTELHEDEQGLHVTGKLVTETRRGAEALALLKARAVTGLSIGFVTRAAERGANGIRILTDINLLEISLVSLPAADKARIQQVRGNEANQWLALITAARDAASSLRSK
jgi:uncharacterized protein